ncbi:hypothetical protein AAIR98_001866 [Elusimicrobium simillimum]|uniref:surface lipoprotein assembly modifier n=1 Tax=Elusimicrobium simillimum TaxID=3143438 RepID=UPI003C6F3BA1
MCALFCFTFLCGGILYAQEPDIVTKSIIVAESLIDQQKPDEAVTILLEAFPLAQNKEDKTQIEFLLGMASMLKEDYATAEWVFRRILKNSPGLTRVRLELALLYFKTGKDEKADYHFRLVNGSKDLPQEVKDKIGFFLYQIRYRKKWDYYLNLGIAPSSNVNNAAGQRYECIYFWGIPLCRELETKKSSIGLSGSAGLEYYQRLSPNLRWKSTLSGTVSDFSGSQYDVHSVGFATGPMYNYRRGSAALYASGSRIWYGGKGMLYDYGPLLQLNYDIAPRASLWLNTSFKFTDYDRKGYDYMNGTDTFVMPSLFYAISSKTYIMLKPSASFIRTEESFSNKEIYRIGLGIGTELPLGISLYVEPSYSNSRAKGEGTFVEDYTFVYKRRRDENYGIEARILSRQINIFGFTPTLNYSYVKTKSNVYSGNYDKHVVEMGITNRF